MYLPRLLPILGIGCLVMVGLGCDGSDGVDPCLTLCERQATCTEAAAGRLAQCKAACAPARTEAAKFSCVDKLDAWTQCQLAADACDAIEPRCLEERAAKLACPVDYCAKNPATPACDPDYCDKNPTAPECKAEFCMKNPTAPVCGGAEEAGACGTYCDKLTNCLSPTGQDVAECKQMCPTARARYRAVNCGSEFDALFQCASRANGCSDYETRQCEWQMEEMTSCVRSYCWSYPTDPLCD